MLKPTDPALILLSEGRKRLPHGRRYCQMHNYRKNGLLNRLTGERVKLECVRIPAGWATTPAAWEKFLVALNKGNGRA